MKIMLFCGTMLGPSGIAVALAFAFTSTTQAQLLVNVQFNSSPGVGNTQSGAALVGSAGDVWNNLGASGASVALNNSGGSASGITLTWSGSAWTVDSGFYNGFHSTAYGKLMDGYLYSIPANGTRHLTLSGLTVGIDYNLYLYSEGDSGSNGRRLTVNVNGVGATTTAAAVYTVGTFIAGQNYLSLPVQADGSGQLDIAYSVGGGTQANLNGFQLAAVPEPAATTVVMVCMI
jgi:hypothetical protein